MAFWLLNLHRSFWEVKSAQNTQTQDRKLSIHYNRGANKSVFFSQWHIDSRLKGLKRLKSHCWIKCISQDVIFFPMPMTVCPSLLLPVANQTCWHLWLVHRKYQKSECTLDLSCLREPVAWAIKSLSCSGPQRVPERLLFSLSWFQQMGQDLDNSCQYQAKKLQETCYSLNYNWAFTVSSLQCTDILNSHLLDLRLPVPNWTECLYF